VGAMVQLPLSAAAPPRKPLYLVARQKMQVGAEAESLVVRMKTGAVRRFPIARIDRIAANGNADWSGAALALCLARGVTITWIGADGQPSGDCCPRVARPSTLHRLVERYLEASRWPDGYGNWLRHRRMAVLVRWARRRGAEGAPVAGDEWEALKREYVYLGRVPERVPDQLFGWCRSHVAARLWTAGVQGRYWGYDGGVLELAEDLTNLLWAGLNLDAGPLLASARDTQALALAFEAGLAERDAVLGDHLAQLRRYLSRAMQSWL